MKNAPESTASQKFLNGEVHDWYRTVWGYSDHLVGRLLDEFASGSKVRVLDPFCGTGTTLVESMKRGHDSVGVDANPASCFASRVKTNWGLAPERLLGLLEPLRDGFHANLLLEEYRADPTYQYLISTGMVARGWISENPLKKSLCLKAAIRTLRASWHYRQALTLALLDTVVRTAANIRFGPELYCGKKKADVDVLGGFEMRVRKIAADLAIARPSRIATARVIQGDARACDELKSAFGPAKFSLVICSPPYPAEHDYTRNSRLELAFLEYVLSLDALRGIKRSMVRSHTKGIYVLDSDSDFVADEASLRGIVSEIDLKALDKTYGFARLYSKVATEYFGGMKRHLKSMGGILKKGAILAYVVGDQSSYLQVPIRTATILGGIAESTGYRVLETRHWRDRQSSTTSKVISENILILRREGKGSDA
jgi:SAM-dependent methyltransferase